MAKKILSYFGRIENGEVTLPKRMRRELVAAFDGVAIEVVVRKKKKHRSTEQNRYWWGVVVDVLLNHLRDVDPSEAWTPEKVHEILKVKYLLQTKADPETGEVLYQYTKSTTNLSTSEFMGLIAQVQQWAAQTFDLYIPDPNEQAELFNN